MKFEVNSTQALSFVAESDCSSYDCEFVALANDLDINLVTFDKRLLSAFPDVAIDPKQFVS